MIKAMRITEKVKARFAANDKFGWHVFYGDTYNGFDNTLTAMQQIEIAKWRGWTFVSHTGNGLEFRK